MCGIGGFVNYKNDFLEKEGLYNKILTDMSDTLKRRGPDVQSILLDKNVGFAHGRLSIRDVAMGSQPMNSECGMYTIVYNGEIYNTSELKSDLEKKGHTFKTTSDTEVVLKAYMEYGEDSPKLLNGIFAYSIFDRRKEQLILVRDRFGVKPLYYFFADDTLIFGSEIKAIASYPNVTLELNDDSLREIFGLFPSRTEGNGVFKGMKEIKYGCIAIYNKDSFVEKQYWKLNSFENKLSFKEAVDKTNFLVTDAIKRQIVSDVPICTFLSGGLDSSIITGVLANELKKDGRSLDTYSFDYEENSLFFKSNAFQVDEDKEWATKISNIFNTNHTYLECGIDDLIDCLYKSVDAKDYVGMADIDSSLLYFSGEVSKNHKVTLTGECADEIFGGYYRSIIMTNEKTYKIRVFLFVFFFFQK